MSENAVWVLDGAGTPHGTSSCCAADASWYVQQLDGAIAAALEGRPDESLRTVLREAIGRVQVQHAAICSDPMSGRGPSSTVAIARRIGNQLDVLLLGDSPILLDHGTGVSHLTDSRLADVARPLRDEIKSALAEGGGYGRAHDARRRRLVAAERASRNLPGGYWIAADAPEAADHALTSTYRTGSDPAAVAQVLLMTDGVSRAATTFDLCRSSPGVLPAVAARRPDACIRRIRQVEADDTRGERYPRTKLSDDATLVVWTLA